MQINKNLKYVKGNKEVKKRCITCAQEVLEKCLKLKSKIYN